MSGYSGGGGGYPPPRPPPYGNNSYGGDNRPKFPPFPPPAGNFPPFPPTAGFNGGPPPPPPTFHNPSPYDEYNPNGPALPPPPGQYPYDAPRKSLDQDVYDPYQSAYDPGAPQIRSSAPPPQPSYSAPKHSLPSSHSLAPPSHRPAQRLGEAHDLPLLTPATTAKIGTYTATVHELPPSHLPITKYVAVNPNDAVDIHRAICQTGMMPSVWYSDGSNRAGEGWAAGVEWIIDSGMSGAKLRACVGPTDALGTELGGIIKAVEGFADQLKQSIRTQKPMSHEFVLFTNSPAAIVSIDTSSRPESIKFCALWREICSDFLKAHMTIAYLPKKSEVEGLTLAEKISTVAALNSYQRRRKERTIDEVYNRPGGGEPAPGGSTEAGPWQRGDADPSRRKSPFNRPKPLPPAPTPPPAAQSPPPPQAAAEAEPEDEGIQPRAGALCVTNFPDDVSAKDLGILFAQFGEILSVDIFSIPPVKPRFAFVAYDDPVTSGTAAVAALHRRPIRLDTPFALENAPDLAIWKGFSGVLTVVESDADRLVPLSVAQDLPDLPDYAIGGRRANERSKSDANRKRERPVEERADIKPFSSPPASSVSTPSPKKRRRSDVRSDVAESTPIEQSLPSHDSHPTTQPSDGADASSRAIAAANADHAPATTPPAPQGNRLLNSHLPHALPPTPLTGQRDQEAAFAPKPSPTETAAVAAAAPAAATDEGPLSNSASEPQEFPIKLSKKTVEAQINLVKNVFVKHDQTNWIAHTCLIATDLDHSRRQLQADLYATDEAVITGGDLEKTLFGRGLTSARIDTCVKKVLKVLDGIAMEDEIENGGPGTDAASEAAPVASERELAELAELLAPLPEQTREAMTAGGKVLEYLYRGKEAQEKKRLDVERRVNVLEGMVKKGEQVSAVVRYLLTEVK
ncbi:hypothetical protein Q8F55_000876 [Vanrija albida]|uniref:RRM domain-containing protein n=1 Tax=Vanrija albida TaxID=181172 RepID=A0ABR3QEQ0_9TREE